MPTIIQSERLSEYMEDAFQHLEDGPMPMGLLVDLAQQSVIKNFETSSDPEGIPWAPRKNPGDGHPLLIDTGTLFGAASGLGEGRIIEIGKREATVGVEGTAVPYAAIHNNGGETRPMPQREYMGMREEDIVQAEEVLADFCLERVWN